MSHATNRVEEQRDEGETDERSELERSDPRFLSSEARIPARCRHEAVVGRPSRASSSRRRSEKQASQATIPRECKVKTPDAKSERSESRL